MENKLNHPKPPLILYQYRPPKDWAFDNLSKCVLHFGSPVGFNDPYDCNHIPRWHDLTKERQESLWQLFAQKHNLPPIPLADVPEAGIEKIAAFFSRLYEKAWRQARVRERLGVACFSVRNDNLAMWSHYGDYGEGFCLAFISPLLSHNYFFRKVKYAKNPPFLFQEGVEPMLDFLAHKPRDWAYEKEWRIFSAIEGKDEEECEKNRRMSYHPGALKAIYLGAKAKDKTKERIRGIVEEKYPLAELWQGRLSKTEYKVEFDRIR